MEESAAQPTQMSNEAEDNLGDRLAILQELYQRKHAELVASLQQSQSFATQDYLQSLQLLQNLQQQQQPGGGAAGALLTPSAIHHHHPYLGTLRQTSSEQSTENEVELASKTDGSLTAASRNRRAFSGSGQTISQTTRDRLKTMIASKKQKQRLHSTGSTGSASNVSSGAAANPSTWIPQLEAPTPRSTWKVNSEPNMKMKLRARILNKGSSPVNHYYPPISSQQATAANHAVLQRCDSDSTSQPMDLLFKSSALAGLDQRVQQQQQAAAGAPSNLVPHSLPPMLWCRPPPCPTSTI
uniref:Uncharacterized protein n=1 Tax=Ditylenchus dipsaci TaxID=166011 RepID=A0A915CTA3_9BILA